MINDTEIESALAFLRDSAKPYGDACGQVELRAHNIKVYRAMAFLGSEGTMAEKEQQAWLDPKVRDAIHEHADAMTTKQTLLTQRKAAELKIEVWRSQQATARQGVNI